MGREENIIVFQDTEKLCKSDEYLQTMIRQSNETQQLILEQAVLPQINLDIYDVPANIIVSKKRTLEAASAYMDQKVAVHNFASATNPGGGVERGANAQEECICRCSSLYFNLTVPEMWDGFYRPHRLAQNPLHNDDIIYTPRVAVFKTDTARPKRMERKDWYQVDVITCAAPNLREHPSNLFNSGDGMKAVEISDAQLMQLHEKRLQRILDVAVMNEVETVVLGAFGCGAFANNPKVVATAARHVMEQYARAFRTIEFAIYCGPRDEQNYRDFQAILC